MQLLILMGISLVLNVIFQSYVPFDFFEFVYVTDFLGALATVTPIFIWAVASIFLLGSTEFGSPLSILKKGFVISSLAGILEELSFRWLFFYSSIIGVIFFDFVTFGLIGWLYEAIGIPVMDFITFGSLHEWYYHPAGWFVGAAIINTNASFRRGHAYQGPIGLLNSWILGFVFFWVMFNHGLITAIFVHFMYNMLIYATMAGRKFLNI